MIRNIVMGFTLATFIASMSMASEEQMSRSEKRWQTFNEKYQPTGNTKRCVQLSRLDDTTILDDQTIFFKTRSKKGYLNRLSHSCPRLASEERFSYNATIGQLCSIDTITVLDSFGHSWASCGLGKFEEWEKKPKDAVTESVETPSVQE